MKVTPINRIPPLNNRKRKKPTKEDIKKLAQSRPPDGIA